ncbi:MAG TPA: hypothetical protein VFT16_04140 [Candidatus Saccharimonadales bacterium]|nr:hypothetical protein [Candidatus Saccharimonadales bacterium]
MKPNIDHAVKIFSSVSEQLGPEYLAYITLPNVVLTLCGARAYCDGVFWSRDNKDLLGKWDKELSALMGVIKGQNVALWSDAVIEQTVAGDKYASYEFIVKDGLHYAITHTNLLGPIRFEDIEAEASRAKIIELLVKNLKSQPALKEYPKESLYDIAFGILLGYPDKAILGTILRWNNNGPFEEPLIDADIRGASYYTCPQPIYSYPRHLMTDPAICAHEKLWSGLLKDYYQSDFHTSLEKNDDFRAKVRELGNPR